MNKLAKKLIIILIVSFLILSSLAIATLILKPGAKKDADVLYGAEKESGYPFVGYLIIENTNKELSLCGVNFVTNSIGLTAAHCVQDYSKIYANSGTFTKNYQDTSYKVIDATVSPIYKQPSSSANAGISDVAVIHFANDAVVAEYPKIGTPTVGCNYFMVGYGRNEDKQEFDRRSTPVCVESIDSNRVILKKGESFFCNGDSGSGIYEKGTNKLIALISSYAYSGDGGCVAGTSFYATRLDSNKSYLSQYLSFDGNQTVQTDNSTQENNSGNTTTITTDSEDTTATTLDPQRDLIVTVLFIGGICAGFGAMLLILILVIRILTKKKPTPVLEPQL